MFKSRYSLRRIKVISAYLRRKDITRDSIPICTPCARRRPHILNEFGFTCVASTERCAICLKPTTSYLVNEGEPT